MPCLEITMPETDQTTRSRLSERLTNAFTEATGHPAEIFGIRFDEFAPGTCASGGRVWDGGDDRPYLHMVLYCGRLRRAQKQVVVQRLSAEFAECVAKPAWLPTVHVAEFPYDNVGVDGQLLSDAFEECRDRPFYYELGDA